MHNSAEQKATKALWRQNKFLPLFLLQFLGAFNDNLFKNALVMLITFRLTAESSQTGFYITLAAGLFILPFFLFSAFAGQLADRYDKVLLIKIIRFAEIVIMLLGAVALLNQQLVLLLFTLFLMGTQSAFFGPIKYSILADILNYQELPQGNSLFSGSTFIAILLGTLFGGVGVLMEHGLLIMSVSVVSVAMIGFLLSLLVQSPYKGDKSVSVRFNVAANTWALMHQGWQHKAALQSAVAISWFWFIGAVLLSQIPALVKYDMQANDDVVVLFLSVFSVGIALGTALVHKLKHKVLENQLLQCAWHGYLLWGMALSLALAVISLQSAQAPALVASMSGGGGSAEVLLSLPDFLSWWPANMALLFLLALALLGGLYIVPLYTRLQRQSPANERARMIALNNILNALFMVLSSVLIMLGFAIGLDLSTMLLVLAGLIMLTALGFKKWLSAI